MRIWHLITVTVLVCLIGAPVTAEVDPVAIAMTIRTSEQCEKRSGDRSHVLDRLSNRAEEGTASR